MDTEIHIVDAFTGTAFHGNPAGVCITDHEPDPVWMQQVAAELKHSETAFLHRAPGGWNLRWFTPASEVDLCGHATLAAAFVLWNSGKTDKSAKIPFLTRSGTLTAWLENGKIALDFPAVPVKRCEPPEGLFAALGSSCVFTGMTQYDILAELPAASDVCDLDPDMDALHAIHARGIIVTAAADTGEYDFVSRFFAPAVGVPEDPVTGSAHCTLGPFWGERLHLTRLTGFQCSTRGGIVRLILNGDRVILTGDAVLVSSGKLLV